MQSPELSLAWKHGVGMLISQAWKLAKEGPRTMSKLKRMVLVYTLNRVFDTNVTTPKGCLKFSVKLDGGVWASMLAPLKEQDRKRDKLYQFYIRNGNNLDGLVGKYVCLSLRKGEYGEVISFTHSCDIISDFKNLLDEHCGNPFSTSLPIFEVLQSKKRKINSDSSITLKSPYSNLDVCKENGTTICYRNDLTEGYLTRQNMRIIYDEFYRDYKEPIENYDKTISIFLGNIGIMMSSESYAKNESKTIAKSLYPLLKLGDKLTDEQCEFLAQKFK